MVQIDFFHRKLICAFLAIGFSLNSIAAQTQLNNWMRTLDGSKSIAEFSIPGTHESSAIIQVWNSKCQNWTLGQQLDRGIRYLDIRCRHINNSFAIHHSSIYQNIYFNNVLDSCRIFLHNNPTETIIMLISHEYSDSIVTRTFRQTFERRYLGNNDTLFYLGDKIPVLDSVRGKIVLLRRFKFERADATSSLGINVTNWPDNDGDFWTNSSNVRVQDNYDFSGCNGITQDKKIVAVRAGITRALFGEKDKLFINYTSASSPGDNAPWCFSQAVNPDLEDYLKPIPFKRIGIIAMDFPETSLITTIIDLNKLPAPSLPAGFSNYFGKPVRIQPGKSTSPVVYWEVEGSKTTSGSLVQLWNSTGPQTKWIFESYDNTKGTVRIKNVNSGKYLGSLTTGNGVRCCLVSNTSTYAQFYVSQAKSDPDHYIFWSVKGDNLPVECENGNLGNSTKIEFWNTTLSRTHWKLTSAK